MIHNRTLQIGFIGLLAISCYFLWQPLLLLYLAYILTIILKPLKDLLNRVIPSPAICAFASVAIFLTILYFISFLLIPSLYKQLYSLAQNLQYLSPDRPKILAQYITNETWDNGTALLQKELLKNVNYLGTQALVLITSQGLMAVTFFIKLYFVSLMCFFILKDTDKIQLLFNRFLAQKHTQEIFILVQSVTNAMRNLVKGQTFVCISLIAYYLICFFLIDLKNFAIFGLIVGASTFVPYLGMIFSIFFTTINILNANPNITIFLLMAVIFIGGTVLESSILTPLFISKKLHIHPLIMLFYILSLGYVFGLLGILLALPSSAILHVILKFTLKKIMGMEFGIQKI